MYKDDVLNFRVPANLKMALRMAAEEDDRSMSMMAVRILREWLTAEGFYRSEDAKAGRPPRRTRR